MKKIVKQQYKNIYNLLYGKHIVNTASKVFEKQI